MKRIIFSLFVAGLVLAACSKKEKPAVATRTAAHSTVSTSRESQGTKANSSMWSNGWCYQPKVNCYQFPEDWIVITASARALLYDAELHGPEHLIDAFNNAALSGIADYTPDEYYDYIMSGDYYIRRGADSPDNVSYYFGTTVVMDSTDCVFALQFKKAKE